MTKKNVTLKQKMQNNIKLQKTQKNTAAMEQNFQTYAEKKKPQNNVRNSKNRVIT